MGGCAARQEETASTMSRKTKASTAGLRVSACTPMLASRGSTRALKISTKYLSSWSSWWRHIVDTRGVLWRIYYSILQPIWWALVSTFQINLSPMFFFSRRDAWVVLATCPDILWHSLLWPGTWFLSIREKNHFFFRFWGTRSSSLRPNWASLVEPWDCSLDSQLLVPLRFSSFSLTWSWKVYLSNIQKNANKY